MSSSGNQSRNHTVALYPSQNPLITCRNESADGYSWPETVTGFTAFLPCKEGAIGELMRPTEYKFVQYLPTKLLRDIKSLFEITYPILVPIVDLNLHLQPK